jgi:signal peptide peptidase SppA
MKEIHYPRVAAYVRSTPWALDPRTFGMMLDLLRYRVHGGQLTREDVRARVGAKRAARPDVRFYRDGELVAAAGHGLPMAGLTEGQAQGSLVMVLGVYGLISQRSSQVDDISGPAGTSVQRLTARFRAGLADPTVKAIAFDVDSPGGSVYGVPELADEIRNARGRKPMEAVANSLMASAAYYVASGADRLWVTPSGEAGSIGVYATHVDLSEFFKLAGEKYTLVAYGENKVMGNPFEPLSEEARADMEKRVAEYGQQFDRDVAKSRGVPVETVRKQMGQGLVFGAKEAAQRGLTDGTATLDEVVARLARQRPAQAAPSASVAVAAVTAVPTVTTATVAISTRTGLRDFAEAERIAAGYRDQRLNGSLTPAGGQA